MPSINTQLGKLEKLLSQQEKKLTNLQKKLVNASVSEKKKIQKEISKTNDSITEIKDLKKEYQEIQEQTAAKKEEEQAAKIYKNKKTKYKAPERHALEAERTPNQELSKPLPTTAEAIENGKEFTNSQLAQFQITPNSPEYKQVNRKLSATLALSSGLVVGTGTLLKLGSAASAGLFGMSALSSAILVGGLVGIAVAVALPLIGMVSKKMIMSLKKSIAKRKQRQENRINMAIRDGYYNPSTSKEKGISKFKTYINNKKQERSIKRNFTPAWVNCSVFGGDPAKKTLCLVGKTPDKKGHFPVISVYARGQRENNEYKEIQAFITKRDISNGKVGFINNKEMELDLTNSNINTVMDEDFLAKQSKQKEAHSKPKTKNNQSSHNKNKKNSKKSTLPKQPLKANFYGKPTEPINDKTETAIPIKDAESNVLATIAAHKRKAKGVKNKPLAAKKDKKVQAAKPSERSAAAKKAAATRAANQRKRSAAAKKAAATRAANQKAKEAAAKKAAAARAAKLAAAKKAKELAAKKIQDQGKIKAPEGQAIKIAGPNGDTTIVFKVQLDAQGQVKKSEIDVNEPRKQAAKPSYVKVNGKVMAASSKSPEKVEVIKSNSKTIKVAEK